MPLEDNSFYIQNIENVNRLTSKILFLGNLAAPFLALGTFLGVFSVPLIFCAKIAVAAFSLSVAQWMLVYVLKRHRLPMYFCLISLTFLIAFMGTNGKVGIYVTYALVIFLSCLYYNKRVMLITTIISYLSYLPF